MDAMTMGCKEVLDAIIKAYEEGSPAAVVTVLGDDWHQKLIYRSEDGTEAVPVPWQEQAANVAAHLLATRKETAITAITAPGGDQLKLAVETVRPKTSLLVFGGGHVGQAVAVMGALLGYPVTVLDDRKEFISRKRFPNPRIRLLALPFEEAPSQVNIASHTAVVIVTRGHQYDEVCLKQVIESSAGYIGMIGSRRRVIAVFERLARAGVPRHLLERVHAPIGLSIGARSPQEIAVAILAEIIQTMSLEPAR